jgi:hypothetical protein
LRLCAGEPCAQVNFSRRKFWPGGVPPESRGVMWGNEDRRLNRRR